MAFTFETIGNNAFLVYCIQPEDTQDTMALGMITKNKIPGMAPVLYTQVNMECFLKYNITAKITMKKFLSGIVTRQRLLGVFSSIAMAFQAAEEYMIDSRSLLLDMDYIYVDVTASRGEMICLPIMNSSEQADVGMFLKNIMFMTRFDQTENCDYVVRIVNYLNSSPVFVPEEFGRLVDELQGKSASVRTQGQCMDMQMQGQSGEIPSHVQAMARQQSMGDLPKSMGVQAQQSLGEQSQPPLPAAQMQYAGTQSQLKTPFVRQLTSGKEDSNGAEGAGQNEHGSFAVPGQNGDGGFAVPGQTGNGSAAVLGQQAWVRPEEASLTAANEKEKGMSIFYLLQHYNKENAEAYKAQKNTRKEAKKNGKEEEKGKKGKKGEKNVVSGSKFAVPGQNTASQSSAVVTQSQGNTYSQQASMQPQGWSSAQQDSMQPQKWPSAQQPSVQLQEGQVSQRAMAQAGVGQSAGFPYTSASTSVSLSMEDNFGDTVVMGEEFGEDTVVLNVVQAAAFQPYLLRCRNNEKIILGKDVFHIGKERNYVDYCISDNMTISRSHADIICKNGQFYIVDNNSTNHTYINGEMIPGNIEISLVHGTKIRLSDEEFEFRTF